MAPSPPRPRERAGNPRPDLQRPGQYHDMTRETDPEAFVSEEQAAQDAIEVAARWDVIGAVPYPADHPATTTRPDLTARPAATAEDYGDNHEDEESATPAPEGEDDRRDSDYVPSPERRKRKSGPRPKAKGKGKESAVEVPAEEEVEEEPLGEGEGKGEGEGDGEGDLYVGEGEEVTVEDTDGDDGEDDEEDATAPADALNVNDAGWKLGDPKTQPLTYYIDSDAVGGVKAKTMRFNVDFNSRDSVNKANKTRRLEVNRAKKRHGILGPLKRPSTRGREYTQASNEMITIIHEDYALHNNGQRIPPAELVDRYNQMSPGQDRTQASMLSHMDRIKELKDMRNSYPAT